MNDLSKKSCVICGSVKLCRAHIIARPFFKFLHLGKFANGPLIALTQIKGKYHKVNVPAQGIYDDGILCAKCDNLFSGYDDYAAKILLKEKFDKIPNVDKGYIISNYDYNKLKLFFLSLVFRASISSRREFSRISLGKYHYKVVKELLLNQDPGAAEEYSVFLAKFDDSDKLQFATKNIQNPFCTKFDQVNYCVFYFSNGIIAYIKVDKRKCIRPIDKLILIPNRPCYVIKRDFETSKEFSLLRKYANNILATS